MQSPADSNDTNLLTTLTRRYETRHRFYESGGNTYHVKININGDFAAQNPSDFAYRAYFSTHGVALGHAAVLLGGRRSARLINSIQDTIAQPRRFTRRLQHLLVELQQLMSFNYSMTTIGTTTQASLCRSLTTQSLRKFAYLLMSSKTYCMKLG